MIDEANTMQTANTNVTALSVHWNSSQNKMEFVKPSKQRKQPRNDGSVPSMPKDPIPPRKRIRKRIETRKPMRSPNPNTSKHANVHCKIVRRTTKRPPELQFHSQPIAPPKPI